MKQTKHKYHYAIKNIKKREGELRMSKMVQAMMDNGDNNSFWYEHKKFKGHLNRILHDATEIRQRADVFSQMYNALYNSVPSDNEEMMKIKHSIRKDLLKYNNTEHVVTINEVGGAVSKMQKNKW